MYAFASLDGVFSLLSPLNILHTLFFFVSPCSLSAAVRPSSLPSLCLSSAPAVCCVFRGCRVCPAVSCCVLLCVRPEAPRRPSVCPAAVCLSLVRHQAQDAVTVWADAPRICPRPDLLLPMCCRVFRCPFRGLSCCLPSVRVCVLLPCVLLPAVVWWQ